MASKLHVAFVWHMHQPLYKDRQTGHYMMPWARLHAIKDYLDMLEPLKPHPLLRQTFNLVPSLLEQLLDYAERDAWDRPLELLVKPVDTWTLDDRVYALERCFDLQWERMLRPHPRYAELLEHREAVRSLGWVEAAQSFNEGDWRDLVVWFNLAWFDPLWREGDPDLAALVAKGRAFSARDGELLVAKNRAYLARVIPAYRAMAESQQIELTTTPYYHPILPLLCDRDSARVARPELPLPAAPFRHPDDARSQIDRGVSFFKQHFGHAPRGMWPSEQAVSPEALGLIAASGLQWALSDEGVLGRSLNLGFARAPNGVPYEATSLYQPYAVETASGPVAMVFRDVVLSDLIGFTYAHQPGEEAASDLHARLTRIRQVLPDGEHYLVTIALDGENCWEHYARDGHDFLASFYGRVAADDSLEMVTVSDYLDRFPPQRRLPAIFSGSWIGSDFTTWIGDPTKNRAWELLARAREAVSARAEACQATPAWLQAWEELYIAEGSDWFWWFGEGHDSGQDELFDAQFRLHLQAAYRLVGLDVPEELERPVALPATLRRTAPRGTIAPAIDGKLDPDEWEGAAVYEAGGTQGAMHAAAKAIARLRFGADARYVYLAVEAGSQLSASEGDELVVYFCHPGRTRHNAGIAFGTSQVTGETRNYQFGHALHVPLGPETGHRSRLEEAGEYGTWQTGHEAARVAVGSAIELALPLSALGVEPGQPLQLVVGVVRQGELLELLPPQHPLELVAPSPEALAR